VEIDKAETWLEVKTADDEISREENRVASNRSVCVLSSIFLVGAGLKPENIAGEDGAFHR
jgi:hypothetical protein